MTVAGPIGQAVVLCGGLGTRLGALTADTPKPLLPVGGTPFLERLLFEIRRFGIRRVVFLAAFRADAVAAFARDACARLGIEGEVVVEPDRAGTGGALWHARPHLDEAFLLFNGDSFFDLNLLDLARLLLDAPDALAAVALRQVDDAARYGTVALDGRTLTRFAEKRGVAEPGLVNGGVYAMRRALVETLRPACSLEQDGLAALASGGRILARIYDGFFIDIGIPQDYERAHRDVPRAQRRGAVFLDRDGVLNEDAGYVGTTDRFVWLAGAQAAVKRLNDMGLFVFVVTNQAGVARGHYPEEAVRVLHSHMAADLAAVGAHIDDIRYCPYHPEGTLPAYARASDWRKPAPGMLLDLMRSWPVDPGRCAMIGDKAIDAEAGRRAQMIGYQLQPGEGLDRAITNVLSRLADGTAAGADASPNRAYIGQQLDRGDAGSY